MNVPQVPSNLCCSLPSIMEIDGKMLSVQRAKCVLNIGNAFLVVREKDELSMEQGKSLQQLFSHMVSFTGWLAS